MRIRIGEGIRDTKLSEWKDLMRGLRNNQPQFLAEWSSMTRNQQKTSYRKKFGKQSGDEFLRAGWGVIRLGPLTQELFSRFMVKLGKALYYYHNKTLFDGVIYAVHVDPMSNENQSDYMNTIFKFAPELAISTRNKKSLSDQFAYRFNNEPQLGIMYAVVQFNEQFIAQIMAVKWDLDKRLQADLLQTGVEAPLQGRFPCPLKHPR